MSTATTTSTATRRVTRKRGSSSSNNSTSVTTAASVNKPSSSSSCRKQDKKSFTIPKKTNQKKELLREIDLNSRECARSVGSILKNSFRSPICKTKFFTERVQVVENPQLTSQFIEKRREMKADGRTDKETADHFAFLSAANETVADQLCREGVTVTGVTSPVHLGDPSMGVYLSKFTDLLRSTQFYEGYKGVLVIFKVMKGRVKPVFESASKTTLLEPTPNYDCHVSKKSKSEKSAFSDLFYSTQYYFYEFGELDMAKRPRQICPYAVVHFRHGSVTETPSPTVTVTMDNTSHHGDDVETGLDPGRVVTSNSDNLKQHEDTTRKWNVKHKYTVWNGEIKNNNKTIQVIMQSAAIALTPIIMPDHLQLSQFISLDMLQTFLPKVLYKTHLDKLECKPAEIFICDLYISHYEMRPSVTDDEDFKLLNQVLIDEQIGIIIPVEDVNIILIPSSYLTYTLGVTGPDTNVNHDVIHTLFLSRKPMISQIVSRCYESCERWKTPVNCQCFYRSTNRSKAEPSKFCLKKFREGVCKAISSQKRHLAMHHVTSDHLPKAVPNAEILSNIFMKQSNNLTAALRRFQDQMKKKQLEKVAEIYSNPGITVKPPPIPPTDPRLNRNKEQQDKGAKIHSNPSKNKLTSDHTKSKYTKTDHLTTPKNMMVASQSSHNSQPRSHSNHQGPHNIQSRSHSNQPQSHSNHQGHHNKGQPSHSNRHLVTKPVQPPKPLSSVNENLKFIDIFDTNKTEPVHVITTTTRMTHQMETEVIRKRQESTGSGGSDDPDAKRLCLSSTDPGVEGPDVCRRDADSTVNEVETIMSAPSIDGRGDERMNSEAEAEARKRVRVEKARKKVEENQKQRQSSDPLNLTSLLGKVPADLAVRLEEKPRPLRPIYTKPQTVKHVEYKSQSNIAVTEPKRVDERPVISSKLAKDPIVQGYLIEAATIRHQGHSSDSNIELEEVDEIPVALISHAANFIPGHLSNHPVPPGWGDPDKTKSSPQLNEHTPESDGMPAGYSLGIRSKDIHRFSNFVTKFGTMQTTDPRNIPQTRPDVLKTLRDPRLRQSPQEQNQPLNQDATFRAPPAHTMALDDGHSRHHETPLSGSTPSNVNKQNQSETLLNTTDPINPTDDITVTKGYDCEPTVSKIPDKYSKLEPNREHQKENIPSLSMRGQGVQLKQEPVDERGGQCVSEKGSENPPSNITVQYKLLLRAATLECKLSRISSAIQQQDSSGQLNSLWKTFVRNLQARLTTLKHSLLSLPSSTGVVYNREGLGDPGSRVKPVFAIMDITTELGGLENQVTSAQFHLGIVETDDDLMATRRLMSIMMSSQEEPAHVDQHPPDDGAKCNDNHPLSSYPVNSVLPEEVIPEIPEEIMELQSPSNEPADLDETEVLHIPLECKGDPDSPDLMMDDPATEVSVKTEPTWIPLRAEGDNGERQGDEEDVGFRGVEDQQPPNPVQSKKIENLKDGSSHIVGGSEVESKSKIIQQPVLYSLQRLGGSKFRSNTPSDPGSPSEVVVDKFTETLTIDIDNADVDSSDNSTIPSPATISITEKLMAVNKRIAELEAKGIFKQPAPSGAVVMDTVTTKTQTISSVEIDGISGLSEKTANQLFSILETWEEKHQDTILNLPEDPIDFHPDNSNHGDKKRRKKGLAKRKKHHHYHRSGKQSKSGARDDYSDLSADETQEDVGPNLIDYNPPLPPNHIIEFIGHFQSAVSQD